MGSLAELADVLACPTCGSPVHVDARGMRCLRGHHVDLARDGTATLAGPRANLTTGDTAAMVAERSAFFDDGHYDVLRAELVRLAAPARGSVIVDAGAGTGHVLSDVVSAEPTTRGLAFDSSKPAVKAAARRSHRVAGAVVDLWQRWPLLDGAVDVVLTVFAPRNADEVARVLVPGGKWIVAMPTGEHLRQLRGRVDLLATPDDKVERLALSLPPALVLSDRSTHRTTLTLSPDDVGHLVRMGPHRHHVDDELLDQQLASLSSTEAVEQVVEIATIVRGEIATR
jgi:23S rRNA (guanine745-N1)-methyltransferase